MKKTKKIVLLLDSNLKKRLDTVRRDGYSLNGFIRAVLREALAKRRRAA